MVLHFEPRFLCTPIKLFSSELTSSIHDQSLAQSILICEVKLRDALFMIYVWNGEEDEEHDALQLLQR